MPSFDVVSELDTVETKNAVDNANRDVSTRFDFKGVDASFEYIEETVVMKAEAEFQLQQMQSMLRDACSKRGVDTSALNPQKIDHVLCHFASKYFKNKIFDMLETAGASIPESKWYTNLYQRGNTGCASIFIMLDEFIETHHISAGETIFCMVPESGRFNCAYMHLTVVG